MADRATGDASFDDSTEAKESAGAAEAGNAAHRRDEEPKPAKATGEPKPRHAPQGLAREFVKTHELAYG